MAQTKKLWQSRTMVLNALTCIAALGVALLGTKEIVDYPRVAFAVTGFVAIANLLLRLLTNQPIGLCLLLSLMGACAFGQSPDPALASYRIAVSQGGGSMSCGSGTGVSPWLACTNVHVVGNASVATIKNPLIGKQWQAEVVARNQGADIALLYVASGDLNWVEVGDDPQPNQPCSMVGYGGDGVPKRGSGRFIAANGLQPDGTPVWHAAVESISGDSGGGLFDHAGKLVAVNWGSDLAGDRSSRSTPASYVSQLAIAWRTKAGATQPEFTQIWGGCFGGQCPQPRPFGGGGMPPKQPITPPTFPQPAPSPTPPLVPIPQPNTDYDKLLEKLAADPRFKGKDGRDGKDGQPGIVDQQMLMNVLRAEITQQIQIQAANGKVPTTDEVVAAVIAKIGPLPKYFEITPRK